MNHYYSLLSKKKKRTKKKQSNKRLFLDTVDQRINTTDKSGIVACRIV